MNPSEICLLALHVTITLCALAGFADSLQRVPLALGDSGTNSGVRVCAHTHVHTYMRTRRPAALSKASVWELVRARQPTLYGLVPLAAPDTWPPRPCACHRQ